MVDPTIQSKNHANAKLVLSLSTVCVQCAMLPTASVVELEDVLLVKMAITSAALALVLLVVLTAANAKQALLAKVVISTTLREMGLASLKHLKTATLRQLLVVHKFRWSALLDAKSALKELEMLLSVLSHWRGTHSMGVEMW